MLPSVLSLQPRYESRRESRVEMSSGVGLLALGATLSLASAVVAEGATISIAGGVLVYKGGGSFFKHTNEFFDKLFCEGEGVETVGGANKNTDFKFPKSNSDIKKVFGIDNKVFHEQVKPEILKQIRNDPIYSKEFKLMGNNPDIGVDSVGNIVFKNVNTGKTLLTDWLFTNFLP